MLSLLGIALIILGFYFNFWWAARASLPLYDRPLIFNNNLLVVLGHLFFTVFIIVGYITLWIYNPWFFGLFVLILISYIFYKRRKLSKQVNFITHMGYGKIDMDGSLWGQLAKNRPLEPIKCRIDATKVKQCGQNCQYFPSVAVVRHTLPTTAKQDVFIESSTVALCQGMLITFDNFAFDKKIGCYYGTYNKGEKYHDEM